MYNDTTGVTVYNDKTSITMYNGKTSITMYNFSSEHNYPMLIENLPNKIIFLKSMMWNLVFVQCFFSWDERVVYQRFLQVWKSCFLDMIFVFVQIKFYPKEYGHITGLVVVECVTPKRFCLSAFCEVHFWISRCFF